MKLLSRQDVISAVITGLTTGVIAWQILVFLGKQLPFGMHPVILSVLVPILWVIGVQLGYVLALMYQPFAQFGKFAAIGFANAMVDFGVLYLLIGATGHTQGPAFASFKAISFTVAMVHSYFWNKYWAFNSGRQTTTSRELTLFASVSVASLVVNVAAAAITVAAGPLGGLDAKAWAGVAAIVGSAVALIFNFIGLRMFVFGKRT